MRQTGKLNLYRMKKGMVNKISSANAKKRFDGKKPGAGKLNGKEKSKTKKFQSINDTFYNVLIEEYMINGAVTASTDKNKK